jgi:hypothetical protein
VSSGLVSVAFMATSVILRVCLLSQTYSVPALFPGGLPVCRVSRLRRFAAGAGWRYVAAPERPGPPLRR